MKGVTKGNIKKYALNEFLKEYKELNTDNKYRPVAVGRYGIRKRESIYSKELAKDYSKNKLIHKGTLTVGMGSKQIDIGILIEDETFAVSPAYHTYEIQGIRCKYLEYCLQSKNIEMFSLYAKRGSRQGKSIDLKRWLTYKIPVYSEKDQIVIEENLNKINYVIELRRKQIDLLDELIKARFVEMFGDVGMGLFNYQTCKLGDVAKVGSSHRVFTTEFVESGIPFYRGTEIGELANGKKPINPYYISEEHYKRLAEDETKPLIGDLLMPSICNKGQVWMVDSEEPFYYKDGRVLCISPNKEVFNSRFLQYFMREKTLVEYPKIGSGSTFAEFKIFLLKDMDVLVPPLELQNQFASFVQEIDKSQFVLHQ